MNKEQLKSITYKVFSDTVMMILALIAVFLLALGFTRLTNTELLAIEVVDALILLAFFLEFVLKVYVEEDRVGYLKTHKFESAVSIIIILSPIAALVTEDYLAATALRLTRLSRLIRIGAYLIKYVNVNIVNPIKALFAKKPPLA